MRGQLHGDVGDGCTIHGGKKTMWRGTQLKQAESLMSKEERGRRWARQQWHLNLLHVNLSEVEDEVEMSEADDNASD